MNTLVSKLPHPLTVYFQRMDDEAAGDPRVENPDSLETMGAEGIRLARFALDMIGALPLDVQDAEQDAVAAVRVQIERRGFLSDDFRRAANRLAHALRAVEARGAPPLGKHTQQLRYAVTALDGALNASEWIGDHLDIETAIGWTRSRALERRR